MHSLVEMRLKNKLTDLTLFSCSSSVFGGLSAEILRAGKNLRFRAHGASMQPRLRDGDLLLVQPVPAGIIRVGDVVLCNNGSDRILAHRVLRRRSGPDGLRFLVQGDQASQPDGWISQAQVYGRVAAIERAGVQIDLHRPVARALGWLAVLLSMWHTLRARLFRATRQLVKCLPEF